MNFVKISLGIVFPILTIPYVSRILLADGMGKVNFAQGVINYFIMLASLGIPMYGVRAVAKERDDKEKLSQLVFELLIIICISTFIVFLLFLIFLNFSNRAKSEKELFIIMSMSIIFTNLGVEWFYQGIEDYTYITKRSVMFNIISFFLLFLIVKEKSDYVKYAFTLVFSACGSGILNFFNLRKHIYYKKKYKLNIKRHIKPIIIVLCFSIATSIYINLDSVMLGYLADDRSVGIYTLSMKFIKIVVVLVTTLGGVLIPRISYYIEKSLVEDFKRVSKLSANFTLMLGIPSIVGIVFLAPEIVTIFGGQDFTDSILCMRIATPIILFLGFSNLIGMQIMYPYGEEKSVLISVIVGAMVSFGMNSILIPRFNHIGAAIATVVAEGSVLVVQLILVRKILEFSLIDKNLVKYLIATLNMSITLMLIYYNMNIGMYSKIIVECVVGALSYFVSLLLLREEIVYMILRKRGKE